MAWGIGGYWVEGGDGGEGEEGGDGGKCMLYTRKKANNRIGPDRTFRERLVDKIWSTPFCCHVLSVAKRRKT